MIEMNVSKTNARAGIITHLIMGLGIHWWAPSYHSSTNLINIALNPSLVAFLSLCPYFEFIKKYKYVITCVGGQHMP